jgi:hypothetical protein
LSVNLFQLFQPICGVRASWSNFWPGVLCATTGFLVAQADNKINGSKKSMRFMVMEIFRSLIRQSTILRKTKSFCGRQYLIRQH